jgi:hypothetical protein
MEKALSQFEGHRRMTFMMLDADIVAVSPTSAGRCAASCGGLRRDYNNVRLNSAVGYNVVILGVWRTRATSRTPTT